MLDGLVVCRPAGGAARRARGCERAAKMAELASLEANQMALDHAISYLADLCRPLVKATGVLADCRRP